MSHKIDQISLFPSNISYTALQIADLKSILNNTDEHLALLIYHKHTRVTITGTCSLFFFDLNSTYSSVILSCDYVPQNIFCPDKNKMNM